MDNHVCENDGCPVHEQCNRYCGKYDLRRIIQNLWVKDHWPTDHGCEAFSEKEETDNHEHSDGS